MAPSVGVTKTISRTRGLIESGSHYEAQQMLKTVYHRHRAKQQLQDSYDILQEGAKLQLQHSQVTCGVELGLMLIEAFSQDKPPADAALAAVLDVLSCLPTSAQPAQAPGPAGDDSAAAHLSEEARLVAAAVKCMQRQKQPEACRRIHDAFAWHIWSTFGWAHMGRATRHFVRGSDAKRFSQALHACSSKALASEADLFVCRAVLQVLAAASNPEATQRQLTYASQLLQEARALAPALDTPLLHFTTMLLQALERKSTALTQLLKQRYQPSLARDPVFGAYLTCVERVYLGVGGGPAGGMGGILGSLLKGLMEPEGDGGEEDDE